MDGRSDREEREEEGEDEGERNESVDQWADEDL